MDETRHDAPAARREDDRFTTGGGQYTDDIACPDALHAVFVRSPYPCAGIVSIATAAALAHGDVVAVLTGADLAAEGFIDAPMPFRFAQGDGSFAAETPRPLLARERVRFVGEPVAMVLARSFAGAQDAAEQVVVEYDEQTCVTEPADARADAAPLVWPERPGNIAYHWRHGDAPGVAAALAASARVVRLTSRGEPGRGDADGGTGGFGVPGRGRPDHRAAVAPEPASVPR